MISKWTLIVFLFPFFALADGDVDGGGGGTVPIDPVDPVWIQSAVEEAKLEIRMLTMYWIRLVERGLAPDVLNDRALAHKFFEVLENSDIEVRMDRPCFTKFGEPVDGSIYSDHANSICISAYRIAPKLIKEMVRPQVYGLIVHELSHLAGADEERATGLQRHVISLFRETGEMDAIHNIDDLSERLSKLTESIFAIKDILERPWTGDLKKAVDKAFQQIYELPPALPWQPFSIHTKIEHDYLIYNLAWVRVAGLSALALTDGEGSSESRETLAKLFYKDRHSLPLRDFLRRDSGSDGERNEFWDELVWRTDELGYVINKLAELGKYFLEQEDHLRRLDRGNPQRKFFDPRFYPPANPWRAYEGGYRVIGREKAGDVDELLHCDDIERVELKSDQHDGLHMLEHRRDGSSIHSLEENGNGDDGYVTALTAVDRGARKRAAKGELWSEFLFRSVETELKALEGGEYTISYDSYQKRKIGRDYFYKKATCRLTLVKE